MRRTLFGKFSDVDRIGPAQISVGEALLFDVREHETADLTLAERRVGAWTFAPWLLVVGHLIIAASMLMHDRPPASGGALAAVFLPLGLSLAADVAAGLVMVWWRQLRMAPHTVWRIMCGYIAAT